MAKTGIAMELLPETSNRIGMLVEVTPKIAKDEINIEVIYAYAQEDKDYFGIVVSGPEKAKSILSDFQIKENEVAVVELENKVRAAEKIALKLKEARIDLSHIYASACASGGAS